MSHSVAVMATLKEHQFEVVAKNWPEISLEFSITYTICFLSHRSRKGNVFPLTNVCPSVWGIINQISSTIDPGFSDWPKAKALQSSQSSSHQIRIQNPQAKKGKESQSHPSLRFPNSSRPKGILGQVTWDMGTGKDLGGMNGLLQLWEGSRSEPLG